MNRDGSNLHPSLGEAGGFIRVSTGPIWSPDGQEIAFMSGELGSGSGLVYVMDADGGNIRQVTGTADVPGNIGMVGWLPNRRQLLLRESKDLKPITADSDCALYTMSADNQRSVVSWFKDGC